MRSVAFTVAVGFGLFFASTLWAPPAQALRCLKVLRRDGNYIVCPDGRVYRIPSRIPGKFAPDIARRRPPEPVVPRAPRPTTMESNSVLVPKREHFGGHHR